MQPTDAAAQVQALAERLLAARLTMFGAALPTIRLWPGMLPAQLPVPVPLPGNAQVVGSAAGPWSSRPGAPPSGEAIDIVLDVPATAAAVFAFYEHALTVAGWSIPPPPPGPGGFAPMARPLSRTFCHGPAGPWLSVTVYDTNGGTGMLDVRLHLNTATPGPCAPAVGARAAGLPAALTRLPTLVPSAGVRLEGMGGGGSDAIWYSNALAYTERPVVAVEGDFAAQLTAAGWSRREGGSEGRVAWSRWTLPEDEDWQGLLLVVAEPEPDRRWLHVRAEQAGGGAGSTHGSWSAGAGGWIGTSTRPLG